MYVSNCRNRNPPENKMPPNSTIDQKRTYATTSMVATGQDGRIKKVAGANGERKEDECSHNVDLGRHWSSWMLRVLL
jgi:hypothetical protein